MLYHSKVTAKKSMIYFTLENRSEEFDSDAFSYFPHDGKVFKLIYPRNLTRKVFSTKQNFLKHNKKVFPTISAV